ncbi:MAG TPA: type ISP restriction/modification enzyme [Phycisphaerae bacterium]|nr:type ISP restriction/modification enzyme [Phycisphaerae bacterium]
MPKLEPIRDYLLALHAIHHSPQKTAELSYRAALENLLNALGQHLDPPVRATHELPDTGAGRPDFGLFESKSGNTRAVVETKAPSEEIPHTADSLQAKKYYAHYRLVLLTNYRDFALVTCETNSPPHIEARCTLAADPKEFWRISPEKLAETKSAQLTDFLTSAMRRNAPISRPKDLAADLARHAREALRRLESQKPEALEPLQHAMEQSLGLHFHGPDGLHFFRSSLIQTLFYGLFSGWMLWRESQPRGMGVPPMFDWKDASEYLALPLIGDLYEEIARPKRLADLHLREPLDWATSSLNHVLPDAFFKNFDRDHAITLFYEPFLQEFDPELRKELGVWYTPPEIVQYMVGRVDQLLRSELKIDDGLADDNVYVLDPACGTGSYLLEVAKRIHQTHKDNGHGAASAAKTKKALTSRIFGFEILPAPYVVSHLQLATLLRQLGTKLAPTERAEIFLTNALTGWEPPKGAKQSLAFPFLQQEQEAARRVKRDAPILVILGNPPYNGFVGVAQDEEADLIAPYKEGLRDKYGISKQVLDDLYVRFFRLAERRIGEVNKKGIVSYISNYSWIDGLSHPIMRESLVKNFDKMWIDRCNGDKYRTGKRTPEGLPDQSMFTTDTQPIGIQVGTAITTFIRSRDEGDSSSPTILVRNLWGMANDKRRELVNTLSLADPSAAYTQVHPGPANRYVLSDVSGADDFDKWPSLTEIMPGQFSAVLTRRDEFVTSIDLPELTQRISEYLDESISDSQIAANYPRAMEAGSGFEPVPARHALLGEAPTQEKFKRFLFRPFDQRWLYYEGRQQLVSRPSPQLNSHMAGCPSFKGSDNLLLIAAKKVRRGPAPLPLVANSLSDVNLIDLGGFCFPRFLVQESGLYGHQVSPNIAVEIIEKFAANEGLLPYDNAGNLTPKALEIADRLFHHVVAVLWSPSYRTESQAALRQDWPRIPIPANIELLNSSADLGRKIADLLLPDKPVPGVTSGKIRPELRNIAIPSKSDNSNIEEPRDTKVEAGWGFRGQKNAVMCGKGNVKPNPDNPTEAVDLYINPTTVWANVPNDVYAMTIGGYPVLKKWLSYREYKVLGRALKLDELTYFSEVARRLKALLLLSPDLDANYKACKAAPLITIT